MSRTKSYSGCCEQYNDQGGNLARSSALQAGYGITTPGFMVSRFCGSGLDAVNTAAAKVMSGQADLIIAGGVEMLSLFSIFGSGGPMISDVSFKDANVQIPQGLSADLIATLHGYTRNDVDALGARSQQRANAAWAKGFFNDSVVPITNEMGDPVLSRDELIRDKVTTESLAKLSPAFEKTGRRLSRLYPIAISADLKGSPRSSRRQFFRNRGWRGRRVDRESANRGATRT